MGMTAILFLSLSVGQTLLSFQCQPWEKHRNLLLEQQESHLLPQYSPYGLLHQNHLGREGP